MNQNKSSNKPTQCVTIAIVCLACVAFILLNISQPVAVVNDNRQEQFSRVLDKHNKRIVADYDESQKCLPINDVFFLKQHKCASSALQNVFMRYGKNHNLSFLLPRRLNMIGSFRQGLKKNLIIPHPAAIYNILCHHLYGFSYEKMKSIMPKAKFVTILRHPAMVLESLYTYFGYNTKGRFGVDFLVFIEEPQKYASSTDKIQKVCRGVPPVQNSMLQYFGLEYKYLRDKQMISRKIDEIKIQFDLVMIAERFDESLVLLRDLLCWEWDEVIVIRKNMRKDQLKHNLTKELIQRIEEWSWGDTKLYRTFLDMFDKKVHAYGKERMARDVATLRTRREDVYRTCIKKSIPGTKAKDKRLLEKNTKVSSYILQENAPPYCIDITKTEMPFTKELQQRQWKIREEILNKTLGEQN